MERSWPEEVRRWPLGVVKVKSKVLPHTKWPCVCVYVCVCLQATKASNCEQLIRSQSNARFSFLCLYIFTNIVLIDLICLLIRPSVQLDD